MSFTIQENIIIIIIIIIDGLFTLLSQIRFELQSVYKFKKVKKEKYFTLYIWVYKKVCYIELF
jgi:hypothetical protein